MGIIDDIETDMKLTIDDLIHVIKTLRNDVDNLRKDVNKLKKDKISRIK